MVRKTTALLTAAVLLFPMVSRGEGDAPVVGEHRWDGHPGLYEPRLAFLAELNRWTGYWETLFPAEKAAPTPAIAALGDELARFKKTASSGMTVSELKETKTAFADWESRFSAAFCSLPGVAESGRDCGAAHQIRSAALTANRAAQKKEKERVAALAAAINGTNADALFDNGASRADGAAPSGAAPSAGTSIVASPSESSSRRGYVDSAPAPKPAPIYVPPPATSDAPDSDPTLIARLVRAIKRLEPREWDGYCLTYVWNALTSTLKENIHAILGAAAQSAHTFIAAIRRVPELMARLNLHAVNPFDGEGRAHLQKGMTIFYDRGVCGFDPDYGHAEIVTDVASDGSSGRATSSNTESVRTSCLSRAVSRGLALVVMPGKAPSSSTGL